MASTDNCLTRRPVEEYVDLIKTQMSQRMQEGRPIRPNSSLEMIAAIVGGALFETAGDIAQLRDQLFLTTMCCDSVERYAAGARIQRRPAAKAKGFVRLKGTPGTAIPADLEFLAVGAGTEYVISGVASNPGEIGEGGGATVLVQAKQPGVDGNLFVARGSEFGMTMSSSYAGIDQRAILHPPGLAGGTDTETCEELRARLIALRRQPVTSGNLAFYDAAVRSFPGVQRVCFSGCKCANCQCGPIVGIYPFFDAGVYPPYGVPPSLVNDDILTYVFGENNGAGEGLAPIGAIGQVMCAQPAMLSVNVYTTQNVNPQLHAVIRSAIVEFFNTVSCVGERFCLSALQQSITVTVPRICIRAVHVCGDDATMADGMVKVACGKFPVVERVSVQARTPPTVPCST